MLVAVAVLVKRLAVLAVQAVAVVVAQAQHHKQTQ
jgi:hypothetical protein